MRRPAQPLKAGIVAQHLRQFVAAPRRQMVGEIDFRHIAGKARHIHGALAAARLFAALHQRRDKRDARALFRPEHVSGMGLPAEGQQRLVHRLERKIRRKRLGCMPDGCTGLRHLHCLFRLRDGLRRRLRRFRRFRFRRCCRFFRLCSGRRLLPGQGFFDLREDLFQAVRFFLLAFEGKELGENAAHGTVARTAHTAHADKRQLIARNVLHKPRRPARQNAEAVERMRAQVFDQGHLLAEQRVGDARRDQAQLIACEQVGSFCPCKLITARLQPFAFGAVRGRLHQRPEFLARGLELHIALHQVVHGRGLHDQSRLQAPSAAFERGAQFVHDERPALTAFEQRGIENDLVRFRQLLQRAPVHTSALIRDEKVCPGRTAVLTQIFEQQRFRIARRSRFDPLQFFLHILQFRLQSFLPGVIAQAAQRLLLVAEERVARALIVIVLRQDLFHLLGRIAAALLREFAERDQPAFHPLLRLLADSHDALILRFRLRNPQRLRQVQPCAAGSLPHALGNTHIAFRRAERSSVDVAAPAVAQLKRARVLRFPSLFRLRFQKRKTAAQHPEEIHIHTGILEHNIHFEQSGQIRQIQQVAAEIFVRNGGKPFSQQGAELRIVHAVEPGKRDLVNLLLHVVR